ncbi:TRAP transporter large permease [uncultured Succinatimonas sp.]|uniref:TRAP transporter large permease n=1 Tax=uncultured Succinatimonas sp. TaxID=1262973 RepID=UPI0025D38A75|nr:TRAP transporter large permease [uncultured Succinatimonas sp.]
MTGLILFGSFAIMLLISVPIALALGVATAVTLFYIDMPVVVVAQRIFTAIDSSSIMAIPFFVLAGNLMTEGGISRRIVDFANAIVGGVRGGLFYVMILSCAFFAALSGSAPATVIAIGAMLYPEMVKRGYPEQRSAGLLAVAGGLGPIIPPSIIMVVYGTITSSSIGDLFKGGIVAGIMITVVLAVICIFLSSREDWPKAEKGVTFKEAMVALYKAGFALFLPVIVLGGIYSGILTPTESAAVAVIYSFVVGVFIYRELPMKDLMRVIITSGKGSAMVLFIIATSTAFSWLFTYAGISQQLIEFITSMHLSATAYCLIVAIILLIFGFFLEGIATCVLMVPLLWPVAESLGVNVIHFGMIVSISNVIGTMTPPVAVNLFAASSVTHLKMGDIAKGEIPFFLGFNLVFFLIVLVPWFSTALS